MDNKIKNSQGGLASTKQGGFLQLIVFILVFLFLLKYFGISLSEVVYWFKTTFADVLR